MKVINIFLSFFIIFLLSCSESAKTPANTLVIGIESGPKELDPRFATDAVSTSITMLIYGGLLMRNKEFHLEPYLAEKVEQPDSTTYVITLRKNIYFHDGRKLTSRDVRYTYESIVDEKTASPQKGDFKEVDSIETPDPSTIIIKLKKESAPFLGNLTTGIVPEGSDNLTGRPVGAGPFYYDSYVRGEVLKLKAFNNYFKGSPELAGVTFKILPDETVRLLELKKGNIHLVSNPITPAVLPWLGKQKNLKIIKKTGTNVSYIGFNMEDKILKNQLVRRAIAHAIDRKSIIKFILKGLAVEANSLPAQINPFYNPALKPYNFDTEKAKKLLDQAGYPTPGNGEYRFKLTYKTSKNPTRKKIAEIFAEQLRNVGIDISIKSFEWGTFFSDIKKGKFQIYSLTWVGIVDPDIYFYIFHSSSFPPNGANRGRYLNPVLDKLLEEGRREMNFQKRKLIYDEVQQIIAESLPYIHLWHSVNVAVINKRVEGFELYPDESLVSLTKVTIKK